MLTIIKNKFKKKGGLESIQKKVGKGRGGDKEEKWLLGDLPSRGTEKQACN